MLDLADGLDRMYTAHLNDDNAEASRLLVDIASECGIYRALHAMAGIGAECLYDVTGCDADCKKKGDPGHFGVMVANVDLEPPDEVFAVRFVLARANLDDDMMLALFQAQPPERVLACAACVLALTAKMMRLAAGVLAPPEGGAAL